MDILRVWKLLKVGSFPCRKMKQKVGSLQVLKVIHQGCCQIGKINSGVNILQCQNVFITITLHQAQKSTLSFTTCIINSASANENIMAQVTEMFYPRIHGVLLVNRIREDIDLRNLISTPMIRSRGFYSSLTDILSTTGVSANFPERHPRTQI